MRFLPCMACKLSRFSSSRRVFGRLKRSLFRSGATSTVARYPSRMTPSGVEPCPYVVSVGKLDGKSTKGPPSLHQRVRAVEKKTHIQPVLSRATKRMRRGSRMIRGRNPSRVLPGLY